MTRINPWDNIFAGDFDAAFRIASENFKADGDDFNLRAKALIHLHGSRYQEALHDFKTLEMRERGIGRLSDDTFLYIGLCYYALDFIADARENFAYPVLCPGDFKWTIDISVPPAILFFFALKTRDLKLLAKARRRMEKRPTHIGLFLTDRITEKEFEKGLITPELEIRQKCRSEFYKAVRCLRDNQQGQYLHHLRNSRAINGRYLEYEYYLSKVELEKFGIEE